MLRITSNPTSVLVDFLGCDKIEEVKYLRVSGLGLKTIELSLYEKLPSLEEIDISNNEIDELTLPTNPKITRLDCSNNDFTQVNFLHQFPGLKSLNITGNPLSIVERLIAACVCPNLRGVDIDLVERAKELDQFYEAKFWPKILELWDCEFGPKYSPRLDPYYFAKLRQHFEKTLKEINLYVQPAYRKLEDYKISCLVTRLMLEVRNKDGTEVPESKHCLDLMDESPLNESDQLIWILNGSQKLTMGVFVKEMLQFEHQVLLPTEDNQQDEISVSDNTVRITDDTKNGEVLKTAGDVLTTINGSNFFQSSKPIKIRFKKNANNTLESQLIHEIYTSPRKLQIPLERVEDSGLITGSPKNKTPRKDGQKAQTDDKIIPRTISGSNDSDIDLSPRSSITLRSATKNNSAQKSPILPEYEGRLTRTSSKSPMKSIQHALPVKRKLSLDCEQKTDAKSDVQQPKNQECLPLDAGKIVRRRSARTDKDQSQKQELASSEEEKMELIKNTLQSFVNDDEILDDGIKSLNDTPLLSLPKTQEWQPHAFFRCHSRLNTIDDCSTSIWRCVFEPSINKPGSTSSCVATCGGNTMCVIDCSTGKIKFKYKESNTKEDFFALAWTTIDLKNYQPVKANILAVGGNFGTVHLIHPSQLTCYSKMKCISGNVSCLVFHHSYPTLLCCGSSNGNIVLWDIGIPDYPDYKTKWSKLQTIEVKTDVLNVAFTYEFDLLLAGCDEGCYGWKLKSNETTVRKTRLHFCHPTPEDDDNLNGNIVVDSLVLLPRNVIATKCAGHHCIYLWNLETTLMMSSEKNTHNIQIIATLDWSNTKTFFINIGASSRCHYLACGDSLGQVWIYNIDKIIKQRKLSSNVYSPSDILQWPDCDIMIEDHLEKYVWDEVIINSVSFSSDGTYLVTATNKNVVGIWK